MKTSVAILATIFALCLTCTSDVPVEAFQSLDEHRHFELYETEYLRNRAKEDFNDWQRLSPGKLIELLEKRQKIGKTVFPSYAIHYNWIKSSDIHLLLLHIDDKSICSVVTMPLSSDLPPQTSTVQDEVRHLVAGYWKGFYPVEANSARVRVTVEEIKRWYVIWNKQFEREPK